MSIDLAPERSRLSILEVSRPQDLEDDGRELIAGLTAEPKTIPSRYFYDDEGSRLFELLCVQPEYYLSRCEHAIIERHAEEIAAFTGCCELVELGSGTARKTRLLLEAYRRAGCAASFVAIDVNRFVIECAADALHADFPDLEVLGLAGTYEQGLRSLPAPAGRRLVLFLGSTIGNLDEAALGKFLATIRASGRPVDYFLVGADLDKPSAYVEAAYNDAAGVAERSNLNVLRHLNWRFGADFDLSKFRHVAFHNREKLRVEAHLRSLADQTVNLRDLGLTVRIREGEYVCTEIMRKFDFAKFVHQVEAAGYEFCQAWFDDNRWFSLSLFRCTDAEGIDLHKTNSLSAI